MNASTVRIIYEIHVARIDIELRDTRRRGYRTANGRIRPYFTFVFFPKASLVMASKLSADEPDQQMLASLLFAAMSKSFDQPYGGIPDEIWLNESTVMFATRLQRLHDNLGITIRSNEIGQHHTGEAERFLVALKQQVWEALPIYMGKQWTMQSNVTEYLTLHELEDIIRDCLIGYHQRINSETELSPLTFWESHCFPRSVDPHRLARLLSEGLRRTITHRGIYYQHRLYWHEDLATFTPGTEVHLYPCPSLARPKTIEVFHQGQWICSAFIFIQSKNQSIPVMLHDLLSMQICSET
jgi:Mu transposase-like protein